MEPEPGTTSLEPKLLRDTERPPAGRRSERPFPRTSRGIAKRSRKTRPNHITSSTRQTTFRIHKIVLFEAQRDESANSDARVPNPTSRDQPSPKQASSPVFMHARGTKRPAETGEFELRSGLAPGSNGRTNEEGGMVGTAAEAIHSGLDKMASFFARLVAFATPNRDAGDGSAKRVKLSDDGHRQGSGSVRWNKPVNGGARSRVQERRWLSTQSSTHKPSIADGQRRRFPDTEDPVGSFTRSAPLAGSYPVDGSPDNDSAPTRILGAASTNGALDSSHTTQAVAAQHPTVPMDPQSRIQLYERMRPRVSLGPVAKPPLSSSGTRTRLRLEDSPQPTKTDGERESPGRDDDTSNRETPQPPTTPPTTPPTRLTVFDDSEGILGTAEAFGKLKISKDVAQREKERERKAREREEEAERQRIEEEREKKRLEEARLRQEAEKRGGLRQPHKELFPALTTEWTARVERSLRPGGGERAETLEARLQPHDFERLVPSTVWLNDNIVNGTLLWLDRFINEAAGVTDVKAKTRKCLMPGSFFFTRLIDHGVKGTERTLRRLGVNKDNILDIEIILMPICQGNHWTLVVVEPRKRKISHFDSMNPAGSDGKRALAKDWMRTVLGDSFVEEEWSFAKYRAPRQTNGWDCGVHTVLNGVCLGLGIEPSAAYSSDQLPDLRKTIAAVLLNQGFKGEFSLAGC